MDLITVTRREGLAFDVCVRGHRVVMDMAPEDGGGDAGCAPAEAFVGSLGACIAMMVQGYCDTCGLGEGAVEVSLAYDLAGQPPVIASIAVDVELPPGVPQDRRKAIRRVAERCVIHETLRAPPQVDIDIL